MAVEEGRLELGTAMTNGMRLMCAWVYRTLARSTRDRPSADTGRVREIEGAGQLYHGHLKHGGLAGWVAPGWAADDALWWGWLTGPIANRRWWRVALPVACKQQVPGSKQARRAAGGGQYVLETGSKYY